jgi:hypothetical protein
MSETESEKRFIAGPIQGTVTSIRVGKTRTYYAVVAVNEENFQGSVTFSLVPNIWKAKEVWPQPGSMVTLSNISWHDTGKQGGWRAKEALFTKGELNKIKEQFDPFLFRSYSPIPIFSTSPIPPYRPPKALLSAWAFPPGPPGLNAVGQSL